MTISEENKTVMNGQVDEIRREVKEGKRFSSDIPAEMRNNDEPARKRSELSWFYMLHMFNFLRNFSEMHGHERIVQVLKEKRFESCGDSESSGLVLTTQTIELWDKRPHIFSCCWRVRPSWTSGRTTRGKRPVPAGPVPPHPLYLT